MKSIVATLALLASAHAFVVPSNDVRSSTALQAEIGRRQFASVAFSAAVIGGASPAFAFGGRGEDYVPKYKDLKLIYELVSPNRLVRGSTGILPIAATLSLTEGCLVGPSCFQV